MSQLQAKHLKDYSSPEFTITDIDLDIDLAGAETRIIAKSQVKRLKPEARVLQLDGESQELVSVKINGADAQYQIAEGSLNIETSLEDFELEIVTQLDPEANKSLEGLYMSDGAYCTQCEAEGFRRITYFLDRPDVLAKYTVRVAADKQAFPFLLSNGNKINSGDLANGRHFVVWQDPFPKPAYLFALVAGDFDLLEDSFVTMNKREVALQVFVDKGNLHKAHHAMESLKKSMKWDETRFDLEYDLDIYMIVAVDFFNMGAMENKGLNVFNTKYVLADKSTATDDDYHGIEAVVGHEYFHNWTGNRVTCRDWFQLSLKEGLTVFRDQEFSSDLGSRAVNRISAIRIIKNQQFAEDSGPMSHPIRPESVIEMNNFYTVTVYNKGAEVIRMMHTLLGEAGFQAGMKLYFTRHDGQAVTCDDFVNAMQDASKVNLSQFKLWYSVAGTPSLQVEDSYDEDTQCYRLTVKQSVAGTAAALHIPFSLELLDTQGASLVNQVLNVTESTQEFVFDDMAQAPTPVLLQDFSAPVKLSYDYQLSQLIHQMRYASSEVARWEASVELVSQAIWHNVAHLASGSTMTLDAQVCDAYKGVLLSSDLDLALIAEIFSISSAASLVEQVESVDIDALAKAREFVVTELATSCEDELLARYRELYSVDAIGARALKNICLKLLVQVSDEHAELAETQFVESINMTDSLAALVSLNNSVTPIRADLMSRFESQWQDTPLVMDKWFSLQGVQDSTAVIDNIKALSQHQAFSFDNPNRVRSLIGSFIAGNTYQFHRADGEGYRYLTECLIKLNATNPQIASRLITPLIQFSKFDLARQAQMKACLQQLIDLEDLSKDLYEKVSKALSL